jgi:subtilisin family serine protease
VHAAGNDGNNLDRKPNFPSPVMNDKKRCSTWIEVGASGSTPADLCAGFSNYGRKSVDVFAPGVDIYSTFTGDTYTRQDGTSMAAPVVSGVAGAVLSYYPTLTAQELKKILLDSSLKYRKTKVSLPESTKVTKFGKLSRTGGVVNLYEAIKLAEKNRKP